MSPPIDHIVYAVPDLEAAMDDLAIRLGMRPVFGGYHLNQGTKNALLNLGNECYLELLAVDTDNTGVKAPRWMGIDLIEQPMVTRWALKSSNLERDAAILSKYDPKLGQIQGGQRKRSDGGILRWEMSLPSATPMVELVPFLTDWQHSTAHPTDQLSKDCILLGLELTHPNPGIILPVFQKLGINLSVLKSDTVSIQVSIQGPKGVIII
jgi:hypothetical protein